MMGWRGNTQITGLIDQFATKSSRDSHHFLNSLLSTEVRKAFGASMDHATKLNHRWKFLVLSPNKTRMSQGHVTSTIKDGIGTATFFHPQSNSLPGDLLRKLASE